MASRWCTLYRGTDAEHAIEPAIAALGTPYRTQYPLFLFTTDLKFFPDFVLTEKRIIIEVDDDSHLTKRKKAADALRTAALVKAGYRVVRCSNEEALSDPRGTVARLMEEAERTPVPDVPQAPPVRKPAAKRTSKASSPGKRAAPRKAVAPPDQCPF